MGDDLADNLALVVSVLAVVLLIQQWTEDQERQETVAAMQRVEQLNRGGGQ